MKKILTLSLMLILISAMASAQSGAGDRIRKQHTYHGFSNGQITRPERFQLRNDAVHYKVAQRNARKDKRISPVERRRLQKMKSHTRRDAFRFRHNGRRR